MPIERLSPRVLVGLSLGAGLAFQLLLGTSYSAAFLDPIAESDGVPVALVVLDAGDIGAAFAERLAESESPVAWVPVATPEEALHGLETKAFVGALVVPANFSVAIDSFATTAPHAAVLTAYTSPGGSRTGALVAERVIDIAVDRLRAAVQERAIASAAPAGGAVPVGGLMTVDQARFVADPVRTEWRVVNPIPPNGANGLAPVYVAMGAWIGGYFGAVALERFRPFTRLSAATRSLVLPAGALAQGALATAALVTVGLHVPDPARLVAVVAVGTWMAYAVVSLFMDGFGLPGVLPAFAILALGLPASGAIYPREMLPPFYQALHDVNPLTWLAEAIRSVLYMTAAGDAVGLTARLVAVAAAASVASIALARLRPTAPQPPSEP